MAKAISPPGKGRIIPLPRLQRPAWPHRVECQGQGRCIMRACPRSGDPGWDYVNGMNDRGGMACRIKCGYRWRADERGWRAQVSLANHAAADK